ncbi:Ig-like domain-containing protein [Mycolicibacterium sphagni]|nr:Ig-like domain-containing protein [Mycolicibacterium sphagni]
MAAPSPRNPRRAKGRHRKPTMFETFDGAQWLRVGAVGVGLAAAVGFGQGTAWAGTDGSSNSGTASDSAGPARSNHQQKQSTTPRASQGRAASKRQSVQPALAASKPPIPAANSVAVPMPTVASVAAAVTPRSAELARQAVHVRIEASDLLNAGRGALENAAGAMKSFPEWGTAAIRGAGARIEDEISRAAGDLTNMFSASGPTAKPAAAVAAATASAAPLGSPAQFVATLQAILNQLVGWPEPPTTVFTTPANYTLDQALDAFDSTIDFYVANPTPATRWISDTMKIINLFVVSALPGYTFSDGLNVLGSLLNRVVPPYTIKDPQSATLTKAQVAAAAVGAMVKVLDTLLAGDFDPQDLENAAEAGGTAGLTDPGSVLNMTFDTSAVPNFFSLIAYTALVAVYDRYKWVALDHLPTATPSQSGQLLAVVSGQVNATDADNDPLVYTYTQPTNGAVVVGVDGSWTYTRTSNVMAVDTDTFTVTIDDSAGQLVDAGLGHPYAPDGHTVTYTVTVNYDGLLTIGV